MVVVVCSFPLASDDPSLISCKFQTFGRESRGTLKHRREEEVQTVRHRHLHGEGRCKRRCTTELEEMSRDFRRE